MVAQREWLEKDYYKVLGVSTTATDKEITRAYRKLAKQYHPDANPGSEERFKEISAAYDVLGDETKRKEYDEVRRLGAAGFGGGFPGRLRRRRWTGGATFRVEDLGDLGRPVRRAGRLFGGGRRGRQRRAAARRGPRGRAAPVLRGRRARGHHVGARGRGGPLRDVRRQRGGARDVAGHLSHVPRPRGARRQPGPVLAEPRSARSAAGAGTIVETPCPTCKGSGVQRRTREVKVRIPAGVEDGQRIRVKGRGAPGRGNGPAGDLYVIVHVDTTTCSGARAATSRSPCRSRSPRPPSAPRSPCRRSTTR